jgi:hypothetical protein
VVSITVRDEAGASVGDADVELRGPLGSGDRVRTDPEGRCRIAGIASPDPGAGYWHRQMWWHVERPGFAAARGSRMITPEPGEETLDITLHRGAPVLVRVVDSAGAPVARASVAGSYGRNAANRIRRHFSSTTGPDGQAVLGRFEPGKWPVVVRRPGKGANAITVEIEVRAKPVARTVVLPAGDASLSGTVRLPDGTPARGGTIGFKRDDGKVKGLGMICLDRIESDGSFRLTGLAPGAGHIHVLADGFAAQARPCELAPGESRDGFVFRLEEAGGLRGRVVSREGEGLAGIPVDLMQRLVYPNGGVSTHEVGHTITGADGSFALRGLADDEYKLHVQTKEWRTIAAMSPGVRAGMSGVVVRMKPASEGFGIRIRVRIATDDGSRPGAPVQVEYSANGDLRMFGPGTPADDGLLEFRFWDEPGAYDLSFLCAGYLPYVVRGVRIADGIDLPVLDVRLRRGAVVRILVRWEDGAPLRGTSVRVGNQLLRTDENGECDAGGLTAGAQDIRVDVVGQRHVFGEAKGVRAPGRTEITIRRWGYAFVRLDGWTYGDLRERLKWSLLDARGEVVDVRSFDLGKVGHGYAETRAVTAWLKTTESGDYRVVVEVDGKHGEVPVRIDLGARTDAVVTPR